jgi:hypothetical protein
VLTRPGSEVRSRRQTNSAHERQLDCIGGREVSFAEKTEGGWAAWHRLAVVVLSRAGVAPRHVGGKMRVCRQKRAERYAERERGAETTQRIAVEPTGAIGTGEGAEPEEGALV